MSIEEAIKHCNEVAEEKIEQAGFDTDNERYRMSESEKADCLKCAGEHRQLANWLQELKERREKESRQIIPQDMTEEACEAMIKLIEKIIEILPDIVESVTANIPEAIEQYIESKIKNGKEESK